ncbi:MAG: sortase [Clostridiales bacterium]|nr:sortase [Clostridiales bacterium]
MARKRKRSLNNPKLQKRDKILQIIQYSCAILCVVFIAILVKTISDDQVSYESQYRTKQLAEQLANSANATPVPTRAPIATPTSAPTMPTSTAAPDANEQPQQTSEAPANVQGETNILAQFFGNNNPVQTPVPDATPIATGSLDVHGDNKAGDSDDLFAAFFGNENEGEDIINDPFAGNSEQEAIEPQATVEPTPEMTAAPTMAPTATPDMSSRFTKYNSVPPVLQQKFMTADFYYANPDFVGFLTAGVDVQEPVPYCRDNEYYLNHNFYGEEDKAGAAFMDGRNKLWPRTQHIVIHGHNMKNGTVFGSLDDMRKLSNLKKYPTVNFDTLYENGTYVIYAAFNASMNKDDKEFFNLERYDFETEESFDAFIAEIKARSMYNIPVDVAYEDELLTLVTCSYYQDNGRFILFTRRLRPNETVESVTDVMQAAIQLSQH